MLKLKSAEEVMKMPEQELEDYRVKLDAAVDELTTHRRIVHESCERFEALRTGAAKLGKMTDMERKVLAAELSKQV